MIPTIFFLDEEGEFVENFSVYERVEKAAARTNSKPLLYRIFCIYLFIREIIFLSGKCQGNLKSDVCKLIVSSRFVVTKTARKSCCKLPGLLTRSSSLSSWRLMKYDNVLVYSLKLLALTSDNDKKTFSLSIIFKKTFVVHNFMIYTTAKKLRK